MNPSERLAELGREFHKRGWALSTSGNFSAVLNRQPLRLAITASSLNKNQLSAEQILEVDSDSLVVDASQSKPSTETLLHLAIVSTTDASAVLHTHSVWSTILSDYHIGRGGF